MTEFDIFNTDDFENSNSHPKNAKYVKMTYTKKGTIVLTPTDNEKDNVTIEELNRYMKAV